MIGVRIGVVALFALCGCGGATAIDAGEWEVTTVSPGRGGAAGVPRTSRHCIAGDGASAPTLRSMLHGSGNPGPRDTAIVAHGRISADTEVDTPERSFRDLPVRITGSYDATSFAVRETVTFMGYDVTTTFDGRRVGDCP